MRTKGLHMDQSRFDALARSLTTAGSRRRALTSLLAGILGLLGSRTDDARAKKKPCPPCKKRKAGKCKKTLPDGTACAGGMCQSGSCIAAPPPPGPSGPTCSDGIQNGSETDIDCGGPSCGRCRNGWHCASRNDCQSARCVGGECFACLESAVCGSDVNGACSCSGSATCVTSASYRSIDACRNCPVGWGCMGSGGVGYCMPPCGSSESCTFTTDACKGNTAECGRGGKCFQPLRGGPTQCGTPTVAGSCGCTSDEDCAIHGAGAFCVEVTGGLCTGCAAGTFCATPR